MEKEGQERCTRQFALNVERNARFRSNLTGQGLFTAEIATRKEGHREDRIEDTSFRRLIFRDLSSDGSYFFPFLSLFLLSALISVPL